MAYTGKGTAGQDYLSTSASQSWSFGTTNAVASADYTILDTDGYKVISVTTGASNRTVTLPAAASANANREVTIMKADSGIGQILISGTVSGTTTAQLGFQYDAVTVFSDGSAWYFKNGFYSSMWSTVTFTFNGTGSPGSQSGDLQIERRGDTVSILFPAVIRATTGTTSTLLSTGTSAIPTWSRPVAAAQVRGAVLRNNAAVDANIGVITINTNGSIDVARDTANTAYTNAASAGFQTDYTATYIIQRV